MACSALPSAASPASAAASHPSESVRSATSASDGSSAATASLSKSAVELAESGLGVDTATVASGGVAGTGLGALKTSARMTTLAARSRTGKLQARPREQELLDFLRRRDAAARSERPAIERRDGVGVRQHVLQILFGRPETAGGEGAAKDVAGAGAVDAVDLKRGRANLAAVAPREAPLRSERHGHHGRAELTSHRRERAAQIFVARQRGRKLLRGDDRVDLLEQIGDARPHLLDGDDRGHPGFAGVPRGLGGRRRLVAVDYQ